MMAALRAAAAGVANMGTAKTSSPPCVRWVEQHARWIGIMFEQHLVLVAPLQSRRHTTQWYGQGGTEEPNNTRSAVTVTKPKVQGPEGGGASNQIFGFLAQIWDPQI